MSTISRLRGSLGSYIEVTRPRIVFLLVFTACATAIIAFKVGSVPFSWWTLLLIIVSTTLGCAGAEAVTSYIDRNIDAIMDRTKHRPIPSRRINPPQKALLWGLVLVLLSLLFAWVLNPLAFGLMVLGLLDNIVVYSLLSKRRSPLNILLGSPSGGIPALVGWTGVTGSLAFLPFLVSALIVAWTPNHIWNLALFFKDDYAKARVPMLPVVIDKKKALNCIASTVVALFLLSIGIFFVGGFSYYFLVVVLAVGIPMVVGNLYSLIRPTAKNSWRMFKYSSPYLFIVFFAMVVDSIMLR